MTSALPAHGHALLIALVAVVALAAVFAATAGLLHAAGARAERRRAACWARWEPILLGLLVGDGDPAAFAGLAARDERADALALLAAYALRLDGDSLGVLARAAAPLLPAGRAGLRARRADRRAYAVRLVGLLGTEADRAALARALRDPSPHVAMTAARALARTHDARYADDLVGALGRFSGWGTTSVASMLALYGLAGAPALVRALADAAAPESTRVACADALRRLGYFPAATAAAALLADGPDGAPASVEVSAAALRLLRDVGGPTEAEAVRARLGSTSDVVRMHAVSALAAVSQHPGDAARIEHALGDGSPWVAARAARGLVESGRAASLRALAAGDGPRSGVARQALTEAGLALAEPPALAEPVLHR